MFTREICIRIVCNFSWDIQPSQEKFETMIMQNFGGQTECIGCSIRDRTETITRAQVNIIHSKSQVITLFDPRCLYFVKFLNFAFFFSFHKLFAGKNNSLECSISSEPSYVQRTTIGS